MADLDIGEVARRSGVSVSALRYYEEKGLISPTGRRGLRRQFDSGVLQRLALITLGRSAGFSLDEIARLIPSDPDDAPGLDRGMLAAKAGELTRTIGELTALRDALEHTAACTAPSHAECPTFREALAHPYAGRIAPFRGKRSLTK
ncbi:MerR family transcriptional regulator [Paractinoplanes deccanensis]|uniref:MerR family transcriptional regulator n=1 Tax=Paractinoplanes deccanensis TaxID=113561 RepID=A0ABQ3Y3F7_9ACTN|nr:helix-turn-helix domain-containing protein [Actinoplanes deccanensis]GID74521.1 MerR family transcriptional regulator [Actinoplanes deccanensis]